MKTLQRLLEKSPSYSKWGNSRLAELSKISENTVKKFKKTETFKTIKTNYLKK